MAATHPAPRGYFCPPLRRRWQRHYLNTASIGGIDTDQLAASATDQRPRDGLAYDSVPGATTGGARLDAHGLRARAASGPTEDRDNFIKYWHLYINVPGDAARDVYYRHCGDDALRIWNNGTLMVYGGAGGSSPRGVSTPA